MTAKPPRFVWWDKGTVTHIIDAAHNPRLVLCGGGCDVRDAHASYTLNGRPLCKACRRVALQRANEWTLLAEGTAQ